MHKQLISAKELQSLVSEGHIVVLDARYSLTDPNAGYQQYKNGHIPGSLFLFQGSDLCSTPTGSNGRHPLPNPQELKQRLLNAGITPNSHIVVYDADTSTFSVRAWWVLKWLGFSNVSVLDGGMQSWLNINGNLSKGEGKTLGQLVSSNKNKFTPQMPTVNASQVLNSIGTNRFKLIDARNTERYAGQTEPLDPVAGHIPGALNRPISANLNSNGTFKSAQQLKNEFNQLLSNIPANQVVHYCGSGITACHNLFAMELAGLNGSFLYPGSWSEWCSDKNRPVATGTS